ncbi:hypothetical protein TELCIR_21750 [Teladorsagia circumcincta]|uniref:Uncharacterized protein n=1 Tax=Teladorsagia circumcincta TaxID=45464 RepID=A0A2G9TFU6_TELCI|nr:hypothetical protein TELCIR_21750 [Teladorsagia circumcincta]
MRDDSARDGLKRDATTNASDWKHGQPSDSTRSFSRTDRRSTVSSSTNSSSVGQRRWPHTLIITIRYRAVTAAAQ